MPRLQTLVVPAPTVALYSRRGPTLEQPWLVADGGLPDAPGAAPALGNPHTLLHLFHRTRHRASPAWAEKPLVERYQFRARRIGLHRAMADDRPVGAGA